MMEPSVVMYLPCKIRNMLLGYLLDSYSRICQAVSSQPHTTVGALTDGPL